ncbi:thioesterase domain-containing protein [Mucilaginibacter xinganensis]|uniref:thioesterase domain-containing protein n=1 Tax=Mucilaginibacter xinganensis TaxID=1234841 RepID=UPI00147975F0|nr:hypothetical protein [Mucilaginibacter xinganensis]
MNMSPEQPVFGLQAKGLDGVEEPLTSIEEIAEHYINSILQQKPGRTLCIGWLLVRWYNCLRNGETIGGIG